MTMYLSIMQSLNQHLITNTDQITTARNSHCKFLSYLEERVADDAILPNMSPKISRILPPACLLLLIHNLRNVQIIDVANKTGVRSSVFLAFIL